MSVPGAVAGDELTHRNSFHGAAMSQAGVAAAPHPQTTKISVARSTRHVTEGLRRRHTGSTLKASSCALDVGIW
jgi:hypothetical protein